MIKRAGSVPNAEDNGGFEFSNFLEIRSRRTGWRDQEKTCVILQVVLNGLGENFATVYGSSAACSDSSRVARPLIHHDLDGAGGVVYRHRLDLWMLTEECLTLSKCNRMRERLSNFAQLDAR